MFREQRNRHVIPRWRDFQTTLSLGELKNTKPRTSLSVADRETLQRRRSDWESDPTIWNAADLLSSSFVVCR